MSTIKDVCLVIPTIRENSFNDFVARWDAVGLFDVVDLIVVEDNPTTTFKPNLSNVNHFSWKDIDNQLQDNSWIIPRRSDTVRSFGYYKAFRYGYKYVLTLDDDCYPTTEQDGVVYDGKGFVNEHLRQLAERSRWFNTLNSVKPRGIPFYNVGKLNNVVLNHGLWTNVLDYDAPFQLANPIKERFSYDNRLVPRGQYFPMCGMNVMWNADVTVLMYHLLMGQKLDNGNLKKLPFDRFGDIWAGIFMKKIVDHAGLSVSTGMPYIRHERASNPFTNLKKEANGIEVNEDLWDFVDNVKLPETRNLAMLYQSLGDAMADFTVRFPKYNEHEKYFVLLSEAMVKWSTLFY